MKRAIALAVAGVLGCILLVLWRGEVMPSYLAVWLFWMALPLGALPLVAAAELIGIPDGPLLSVLRRMLLLLPLGAILSVPLMLRADLLYHRVAMPKALAAWMATPSLIVRMAVMLVVWSGLALLLARPPRDQPRRKLAGLVLVLHPVMASIAALDWVMSLAPGLGSSAFGLLSIAGQVVTAGCAGLFVLALRSGGRRLPTPPGLLLACLLGGWAFLHFAQYLVVWSANLPAEIVWYQQRSSGLGGPFIWAAAAAALLGLVLLPSRLSRVPVLAASVAAMLLLGHLLETLWFVTPPFRGGFSLWGADVVALVGLGGLSLALLSVAFGSVSSVQARHDAG